VHSLEVRETTPPDGETMLDVYHILAKLKASGEIMELKNGYFSTV